jgi:hypothetical protein
VAPLRPHHRRGHRRGAGYLPGADAWPLLARLVVKVAIFAPLCWAAVRALRLPRHLPPVPAD